MGEGVSRVKAFSSNLELFNSIIDDLKNAQKSIFFEMYRITKDPIGQLFRDSLSEALDRGVRVVLLIDAWGTGTNKSFFKILIEKGANFRIFNTFRLGTRLITQSHRRNHRKIIIIDDNISYLGSANISYYSLVWREFTLRMEGTIAKPLKKIIETDFKNYRRLVYTKRFFTRSINHKGFEIVRDVPSIYKQKVMRKFLYLIKNAKKTVYIETPYFLPGYRLRKAMADAVARGVEVIVVFPKHSDVTIVDILRNKYLGKMHKSGVNLKYYFQNNLHSKIMIVDDDLFAFGSSNFDYRSFRYMHEIVLVGKNQLVLQELSSHKSKTLMSTFDFDYNIWRNRTLFDKVFPYLLVPFRFFL